MSSRSCNERSPVSRRDARAAAAPAARAAPASTGTRTGTRRRRRGGTRADQAVALIKANPGISASEIASKMKIQPNYMYRVLGDLQKEGKVKKSGRKYTAT